MGCVGTDSWLWPYLAGIATMTMLLWILALARLSNFAGSSARHTHFTQLSNLTVDRIHELSRDRQSLQRNPNRHQPKDGRLHCPATDSVRRPSCLPRSTVRDAAPGGSGPARPGPQERGSPGGRIQSASQEEQTCTRFASQKPDPCTKYTP
jgi:hypothetical protein